MQRNNYKSLQGLELEVHFKKQLFGEFQEAVQGLKGIEQGNAKSLPTSELRNKLVVELISFLW
jgi:hypothetical protein